MAEFQMNEEIRWVDGWKVRIMLMARNVITLEEGSWYAFVFNPNFILPDSVLVFTSDLKQLDAFTSRNILFIRTNDYVNLRMGDFLYVFFDGDYVPNYEFDEYELTFNNYEIGYGSSGLEEFVNVSDDGKTITVGLYNTKYYSGKLVWWLPFLVSNRGIIKFEFEMKTEGNTRGYAVFEPLAEYHGIRGIHFFLPDYLYLFDDTYNVIGMFNFGEWSKVEGEVVLNTKNDGNNTYHHVKLSVDKYFTHEFDVVDSHASYSLNQYGLYFASYDDSLTNPESATFSVRNFKVKVLNVDSSYMIDEDFEIIRVDFDNNSRKYVEVTDYNPVFDYEHVEDSLLFSRIIRADTELKNKLVLYSEQPYLKYEYPWYVDGINVLVGGINSGEKVERKYLGNIDGYDLWVFRIPIYSLFANSTLISWVNSAEEFDDIMVNDGWRLAFRVDDEFFDSYGVNLNGTFVDNIPAFNEFLIEGHVYVPADAVYYMEYDTSGSRLMPSYVSIDGEIMETTWVDGKSVIIKKLEPGIHHFRLFFNKNGFEQTLYYWYVDNINLTKLDVGSVIYDGKTVSLLDLKSFSGSDIVVAKIDRFYDDYVDLWVKDVSLEINVYSKLYAMLGYDTKLIGNISLLGDSIRYDSVNINDDLSTGIKNWTINYLGSMNDIHMIDINAIVWNGERLGVANKIFHF